MYEIDEYINSGSNKISVRLNSNTTLNIHGIRYPIIWKGFIGGYAVEIIQISQTSSQKVILHFTYFLVNWTVTNTILSPRLIGSYGGN